MAKFVYPERSRRNCPGTKLIKQPIPEHIKCSNCGYEVEIWSDESSQKCPNCQREVKRQIVPSCADWCSYAKQCLGEELYMRYLELKLKQEKSKTQQ